jgi:hypothetical protein
MDQEKKADFEDWDANEEETPKNATLTYRGKPEATPLLTASTSSTLLNVPPSNRTVIGGASGGLGGNNNNARDAAPFRVTACMELMYALDQTVPVYVGYEGIASVILAVMGGSTIGTFLKAGNLFKYFSPVEYIPLATLIMLHVAYKSRSTLSSIGALFMFMVLSVLHAKIVNFILRCLFGMLDQL